MADDVATLGIQIDSSSIREATDALRNFESVGRRTGETAQQAQTRFADIARQRQQATAAQTTATQAAADQARRAAVANDNLDKSQQRVTSSGLSQRAMWRLLARDAALFDSTLAGVLRTMGLMSISGSRLGAGATLLTGAFFAVAGAALYAAKAFVEMQNAQVRLGNALAFTKNASGQTVQGIENISRRLSESGLVSTKEVREAALELLRFKDVTASSFEDVLEISKRVASTGFVPLKEAAGTIGKALSDVGNATETLRGANISLSDGVQIVIDQLLRQGKVFEAQKVLLDDLRKRTEGIEDGTNTVSSAWSRWTDAIKNNAASLFAEFANWSSLQDKMDKWTQNIRDQVKEREKLANLPALSIGAVRSAVGLPSQTPGEQATLNQKKQEQATLEVTRALLQQQETLGKTALELEVYNQTIAKGIPAYSEAAQKIREMVSAAMMTTELKSITDGLKQQVEQARIEAATVGMSAGAAAAYRAEQTAIFQLRQKGLEPGAKEIAQIKEQTAALGKNTQAAQSNKAELDARFKLQTVWMSETERQIAEVQRSLHGEAWREFMDDGVSATMRLTAAVEELRDAITRMAQDLVSGLLEGKSAGEALDTALKGVTRTAANSAVTKLVQGDIYGAGVSAAIAGGAYLADRMFGGGDRKAQQEAYQRQQEAIREQQQQELERQKRQVELQVRAQLAGLDTSNLAGRMKEYEIRANQERYQEALNGGRNMADLERALAAEREAIIKDFAEKAKARERSYQDRLFAVTNDATTLVGQLAAYDRRAAQEREDEQKAGGEAMVALEQAQAAERLKIINDYNQQIVESHKKAANDILDYLKNLSLGRLSILSPAEQLRAAQAQYQERLAAARGGDQEALSKITQAADALLTSARAFYASSAAYGQIYGQVTSDLSALAQMTGGNKGGLVGYAFGGLIGNGRYNIDSVLARYAGGRGVALSGGEYVVRAPSVTPRTLPLLQSINRTGGANDNSALIAHFQSLLREIMTMRSQSASLLSQIGVAVSDSLRETRGLRTDVRQGSAEKVLRTATGK